MEKYYKVEDGLRLEDIYDEVFCLESEEVKCLGEDITRKFKIAQDTFEGADEESADFLRQFTFICLLSFDVYTKKLLIEKLIDGMKGAKDDVK